MGIEHGTPKGKGKDSMTNDRKMIVKVVERGTNRGMLVLRQCPTWGEILGEKVEIDLATAQKKSGFVRFNGMMLTGVRAGVSLSISTAIMGLTPEQYRRIESLLGGETEIAAM